MLDPHAVSPAPVPLVVGAELPRATGADHARTLLAAAGREHAVLPTLSTISAAADGYPFGSVVGATGDPDGNPLFVVSELAEHTRNLRLDPRSSLLVVEAGDGGDPLDGGRLTLVGRCAPVPDDEQADATAVVVAAYPDVGNYAGFPDFNCWRLTVEAVRWVGGFGRMDWLDLDAYQSAQPDPVLPHRRRIVDHMNDDHADSGTELCQRAITDAGSALAVERAVMVGVDRFGCDYQATVVDEAAVVPIRLPFAALANSVGDVRAELVAMVRNR